MGLTSVIIPVFRNENSLTDLFSQLAFIDRELGSVEFIFVIDGSPDNSEEIIRSFAASSPLKIKLIPLTRNFGAVRASRFGMMQARGEYVTIMAADLQDPPSLVINMVQRLKDGSNEVVVGVRADRHDPIITKLLASFAWKILQKSVLNSLPNNGFDTYAITANVSKYLIAMTEPHFSPISQLLWLGFAFEEVKYVRNERHSGKSSWKFRAKFQYLIDSIVGISNFPFKIMTFTAVSAMFFAVFLTVSTVWSRFSGDIAIEGYATLQILILLAIGLQQISTLILGAYVWRNYQATLKRPIAIPKEIQEFS